MKKSAFQSGRTNAYLNTRGLHSEVEVEVVADNLMMLYVVFPIDDPHVDGAAWLLAHAVDVVALAIEKETGNPFNSFLLCFTQAWNMVSARKTNARKKSADIPALPRFLR